MAWLARYGKGIDAANIMRWWPQSDVDRLMRALVKMLEAENKR